MSYLKTNAYKQIQQTSKRIRIIQGGTSASKTVSIIMWLIVLAQHDTEPKLASIVSESFPHLKRGAIRDFLLIMQAQNGFDDECWNKTDYTYTFPNGSKIEFFSVDQPGKVRGPRRDRLFINEANNISYDTFEQLEVRTKDFIFIDYNPVSEFWIQTEIIGKRNDTDFLILTYKDNEALSQEIISSIEQRKNRAGWWKVYGLGELGDIEGKIYTNWAIIDEVPHEARLERYGLDFGYTNDPTAIVAVYYYNGGYIFDEITYQKGLSNQDLANILKNLPAKLVIADSAEPKSIAEIKSYGINILPTVKGKDSVRHGIQQVQDQQISITKQSVNLIKEYRNYLWKVDNNGRVIQEPEKGNDHALDAIRYAITSLVPIIKRKEIMAMMPVFEQKKPINPAL